MRSDLHCPKPCRAALCRLDRDGDILSNILGCFALPSDRRARPSPRWEARQSRRCWNAPTYNSLRGLPQRSQPVANVYAARRGAGAAVGARCGALPGGSRFSVLGSQPARPARAARESVIARPFEIIAAMLRRAWRGLAGERAAAFERATIRTCACSTGDGRPAHPDHRACSAALRRSNAQRPLPTKLRRTCRRAQAALHSNANF